MLLLAILTYHLAYQRGPIAVTVTYQTVADRYGLGAITSGDVTIDNGPKHFKIDLAHLMPITAHHIVLSKDGGCGILQPLAVILHYVAVEAIWSEKGCRPVAYFIDADSGAIVETVDIDHRWDHRLDVQPAHFRGTSIHVESVDQVMLQLAHFDRSGYRIDGHVPWRFVMVQGRDTDGNTRRYAYEYTRGHWGTTMPDPGWNIFPSPGSVVYVGLLTGLFPFSYHPDPEVLRLSVSDDARYAEHQAPTTREYTRAMQREQWLELSEDDAAASRFRQAVEDLAKMLSVEDDASLYSGEKSFYEQCRAMVAQLQAGKMSATSARSAWLNGCRTQTAGPSAEPNRWR